MTTKAQVSLQKIFHTYDNQFILVIIPWLLQIHTYMCTYIYTYTYVHTHIHTYVYIHIIYIYTYTHTYVYTYVYAYICTYIHTNKTDMLKVKSDKKLKHFQCTVLITLNSDFCYFRDLNFFNYNFTIPPATIKYEGNSFIL